MKPTVSRSLLPIAANSFFSTGWLRLLLFVACFACLMAFARVSLADEPAAPADTAFTGDKTSWHGFDRYDFLMDESTMEITPTNATPREGTGYNSVQGQRRCIVVVPQMAAPGNPWSWRGCYWDHQPQTEIELLKRGFHIAYVESSATLKPGPEWEAWYAFLTQKHGLSTRPSFVGMSRGGEYALTWGTSHPDEVSCLYVDNPGGNPGIFANLRGMATNDVPLLEVCGSIDPLLGRVAMPVESIYQQFGGRVTVMIKEGRGHHPHSLRDPKPLADWIEKNTPLVKHATPAYAGTKFTRISYYSNQNNYQKFPSEGTYITCRGPGYVACYDRYDFDLPKIEGTITVIEPDSPAPGNPWVYRAGFVPRDAVMDQALLARGLRIVVGPISYNADGPILPQWTAVYDYLTGFGFSKKPVMQGEGGGAGAVYAWAITNPDKVACIYAENPILNTVVSGIRPLSRMSTLADAHVPVIIVSGQFDPALDDNTRAAEKQYGEHGDFIDIIPNGEGHYMSPGDSIQAIGFIMDYVK